MPQQRMQQDGLQQCGDDALICFEEMATAVAAAVAASWAVWG
jgi:hypothetical protein